MYLSLDMILIGVEHTQYNVSESDGKEEICVTVTSNNTQCPYMGSFEIKLSTFNKSAGTIIYVYMKL